MLVLALYALVAALVAVIVRFYDAPKADFDATEIGKAFVGAIIAVGLTMWFMDGTDLFKPEIFAIVAGAGVGGMSVVRGLLEKFKAAA